MNRESNENSNYYFLKNHPQNKMLGLESLHYSKKIEENQKIENNLLPNRFTI